MIQCVKQLLLLILKVERLKRRKILRVVHRTEGNRSAYRQHQRGSCVRSSGTCSYRLLHRPSLVGAGHYARSARGCHTILLRAGGGQPRRSLPRRQQSQFRQGHGEMRHDLRRHPSPVRLEQSGHQRPRVLRNSAGGVFSYRKIIGMTSHFFAAGRKN